MAAIGLATSGCVVARHSSLTASEEPKLHANSKPDNFTKIRLEGAANVNWTPSKTASLKIEGPERSVRYTETRVEGGWLIVSQRPMTIINGPATVTVSSATLDEVDWLGAGNFRAEGLNVKSFRVNLSGAGNVAVNGQADSAAFTLYGAGNLSADGLQTKDVTVSVSGTGKAEVYASDALSAEVSGVGTVLYSGKPSKVKRSLSGVGRIEPK